MLTRRRFLVGSGVAIVGSAVLARRLPMGSGAGSFSARPTAFELLAAPSGGWTWFTDPRAVSYNGYTYFGYVNGSGDVALRSVPETTLVPGSEIVLHAAMEVDDHDNPSIFIRPSDHKLVTFYGRHLGSTMYKRVSTNSLDSDPTLSGGFASEVDLDSALGGTQYTYSNPVALNNADGDGLDSLWLFFRNHISGVPHWWYARSDDGGMTWITAGLHDQTYSRVVSDGVGRIDVVVATHPNGGDDSDVSHVRHIYRESSAWRKSDGTSIGGGLPIAKASMTTVYDSGGPPVWIWDIAYGLDGKPVISFVVFNSTTDHRAWYARWTGSAWDTHEIVGMGTYLPTAVVGGNPIEAYYSGGVVLDHADPSIVYVSVGLGSDLWEVRRYVTSDGGATWAYRVVSRPGGKNFRPVVIRGHSSALAVLWPRGTYASYVDYSVGTEGVAAG